MTAEATLSDQECLRCEGNGWHPVRRVLSVRSPVQVFEETCEQCHGSGVVQEDEHDS